MALFAFALFAVVSGYEGVHGAESCGCFGEVAISPWYAFALDVVAVGALILIRPKMKTLTTLLPAHRRLVGLATLVLATVVPSAWVLASRPAIGLTPEGLAAAAASSLPTAQPVVSEPSRANAAPGNPSATQPAKMAAQSGGKSGGKSGNKSGDTSGGKSGGISGVGISGGAPAQSDSLVHLVDLHYVEPDDQQTATFQVKNPTNKAWTIRKVETECTCMTLKSEVKVIPANGTTSLEVAFHAPKTVGPYDKRILLLTDDAQAKAITLELKARVGLPLTVEPATVDLGTLPAGQSSSQKIAIANAGKVPVKILYATSSSPDCVVKVPAAAVAGPGGSYSLTVMVSPPPVASPSPTSGGTRQVALFIHTDSSAQSSLQVPIRYGVTSSSAGQLNQPSAPATQSAAARMPK